MKTINLQQLEYRNKLLDFVKQVIRPYSDIDVEKRTGIRRETIARWRDTASPNPGSRSLMFLLDKYGYTIQLVEKNIGATKRLNLFHEHRT